MRGEGAAALYEAAELIIASNDGVGDVDELYNILEGYALQYLDEQED